MLTFAIRSQPLGMSQVASLSGYAISSLRKDLINDQIIAP